MKALFYPAWHQLEISDQPKPQPREGEVLLAVDACGICGSELETFKNRSPRRQPPLIMGHEFCGTVAAVGAGVPDWQPGQQVVSHSLVSCGDCHACRRGNAHLCGQRQIFGMHRPGAFAEFVSVPASTLVPWPPSLPAPAAALAEPLANGIHVASLVRACHPQVACIIGAGPIGLMCQQAIQALLGTSSIVVDLVPERLAVAQRLGAALTLDGRHEDVAATVRNFTAGEGVDVVVDAAGSARTKQLALALVRPGGTVVWIGLHENAIAFDSYQVTLSEIAIFGSYAATMAEQQQAVTLMADGRVDVTSWVQSFPLDHGVAAFEAMLDAQGANIKAVLLP